MSCKDAIGEFISNRRSHSGRGKSIWGVNKGDSNNIRRRLHSLNRNRLVVRLSAAKQEYPVDDNSGPDAALQLLENRGDQLADTTVDSPKKLRQLPINF